MNPPTELPVPRRTWFTNLVGTAAICLGGIGSLFSAFAVLLDDAVEDSRAIAWERF